MTDIVERLRAGWPVRQSAPDSDLLREAADEIERLRIELNRLERAYDQLREVYMNTVAR